MRASEPIKVTVVVLTWNGIDYTKACLDSLKRSTNFTNVDVVVVDNGSTDGTIEYLKSVPWIKTLFNGDNLGFVKGNNAALRLIDADRDVVLLNNDTEIHDPHWIEKLQQTAYHEENIGIVGCRIRRLGSDMLQHIGTYMPDFTYWGQQIGGGEKDINQGNQDFDVEGVVFACVYIKRIVIDRVGLLDEDYVSYFEDTDYCLKTKVAGFRIVLCGALTILHREHGSSAVNQINWNKIFLRSQATFLSKWREYLDRRLDMNVVLHSTFSRPVGYAMSCQRIALALEDVGIAVAYEYLYGKTTVFPIDEDRTASSGNYRIEIIKRRQPQPDAVRLIYGQADAFETVQGSYRIGFTMLETSGIPAEWVRQCNLMDEVWVPSAFNAWTFKRSGVSVPICIMPLGLIDTRYLNPKVKGYPIDGVFTFLSIFEWGERKAPEILLRAFNRAFRRSEQVVLVCKYTNSDPGVDPDRVISSLELDPEGGRVVISENESVSYQEIGQLYRSANCFVLPTRGEGWGMPILEAMACGLPVIASYWSAQQMYMNDSNSYPLQVRLTNAEAKCPYYAGFKWADPDEDHLVYLLRRVYENQDEARLKGERAAKDVADKWSTDSTGQRIRERLTQIMRTRLISGSKYVYDGRRQVKHRVAIDVSRSLGREVTGVGKYTIGVLKGLKKLSLMNPDFEFLLLPGFCDFVHPEYGRSVDFEFDCDDSMTIYRGPLPAFRNEDYFVPGVDLVHCTSNCVPNNLDSLSSFVVYDTTFISHRQFHTEENIRLCETNFEKAVKSDAFFCAISNNSKQDLIKYFGVDPGRVGIATCGVDPEEFHPRSRLECISVRHKYDLPERYFLFVGSMEPRKNLASAIQAMDIYTGNERLVIVGAAGWMNSHLTKLIERYRSKVQVLGYVSQHDLPAIYSSAVATIYPSLYEGFGLPVVESMACGTPVITSNNSSLREIGEGATLLLENPLDPEEASKALLRLAEDMAFRDALVEKGAQRAAMYTPEISALSTLRIFNHMLGFEVTR